MLRRSQYVHLVPLGHEGEMCLHAAIGKTTVLARDLAAIVEHFNAAQDRDEAILDLQQQLGVPREVIDGHINWLVEAHILGQLTSEAETAALAQQLTASPGRDPVERLRRYRREQTRASLAHASADQHQRISDDHVANGPSCDIILVGDCDAVNEDRFLLAEGRRRGIQTRVTTTTPDDISLLAETKHDVVIVGALRARVAVAEGTPSDHGGDPSKYLIDEAKVTLQRIRSATTAPILINNLPIPTVQPLGIALRGPFSHRNRFRAANLGLERVAEEFPDVYVADIEGALAAIGKDMLVDDALHSFTHCAGNGQFLAQWPDTVNAAALGFFPSAADLEAHIGPDPYAFEACVASEHMDMVVAVLGIDRRKCVIVDLDGTLWPGVLAETGKPWVGFSTIGLVGWFYAGIHEALKSLMRRGILLACVSKNDEATVRELWKYEGQDDWSLKRLLVLDDFASYRINWNDKVDNIRAVAAELNLALHHIVFVDDNPVERERVRQFLPDVLVVGDDLVGLRCWLLSDPRLQPLAITAESAARTQLIKAQQQREQLRNHLDDEAAFRESLGLVCDIARLRPGDDVLRLKELFERTTQFNTTGRKFTAGELSAMLEQPHCHVFSLRVRDRFGDHGMVGGCVVEDGNIEILAMSCRVLGVGVEHRFMARILADVSEQRETLKASLHVTPRNLPVRNIYKDHGFVRLDDGIWQLDLAQSKAVPVALDA
jgi:FkbH-like protein